MSLEKRQEQEGIKPADELKWAMEGLSGGDYGEVENCLNAFATKVSESGPSAEEREALKSTLGALKGQIESADIPEVSRSRIARALESAESSL
ncbi:MAG: hypothetical protein WCV69_00450 [Patescibacteria group bacterium]|jgi:hypothetical protein